MLQAFCVLRVAVKRQSCLHLGSAVLGNGFDECSTLDFEKQEKEIDFLEFAAKEVRRAEI